MDAALIISALSIGFLGSFHCIGMCGAIALSLPVQNLEGNKKVIGIILYNLGRACTYALLGGLIGSLGNIFNIWGWQQAISIGLGTIMVIACILTLANKKLVQQSSWMNKWNQNVIKWIAPLFKSTKTTTPFCIGLLNGLLPCGLVYMAIAGALATHSTINGMLFMALFGIGTMPIMFAACFSGQFIHIKWRNLIRKSTPYIIGCMGIILLLRGANLDIPYLSPIMNQGHVQCCHR